MKISPLTIAIVAMLAGSMAGKAETAATPPAGATTTTAALETSKPAPPPGVVATVDGYDITLSEVERRALDQEGAKAFTNLLNNAVVFDEAKKQGITVTELQVAERIAEMRTVYGKNDSLEDEIKRHGSTMQALEDSERYHIAIQLLAAKGVKPPAMTHIRKIVISTTKHTEAEAQAIFARIQDQIKAGKDFADLAQQYSEDDDTKAHGGDMRVVYDGIQLWISITPEEISQAAALKRGETAQKTVKDYGGDALLYAVSTGDDHPADEDDAYTLAKDRYLTDQGAQHEDDMLQTLTAKAKIVDYLKQSPNGVHGLAATVNGQNITMADVASRAVNIARGELVPRLINMRLATAEAERQHIPAVTTADIENVKDILRKRMVGETLEKHYLDAHIPMSVLDDDLRYHITLNRLAGKDAIAPKMSHVRRILIRAPDAKTPLPVLSPYQSPSTSDPAILTAIATVNKIQQLLKSGKKFEDLARLYSQDASSKNGGDLGIMYAGEVPPPDADVLGAALALKKGEVTQTAVKSTDGYNLVELVSTTDDHPRGEDELYTRAMWSYREQVGSAFADSYLAKLKSKAKIKVYPAQ